MVDKTKKKTKIDFLKSMQVLELKPGDTIALTYPGRLSGTAHEAICRQFTKEFPNNRFLILDEGLKLGILRDKPE